MTHRYTDVIKRVMPAVVSVVIAKHLEDVERELPEELMPFISPDAPHHGIPEDAIDSRGMVKIGGGSGFIADPAGIVLTNKHVIAERRAEYTVITDDGATHKAKVLARDPIDDIAILKIEEKNLPTIALGDSSSVELGEEVLAVGNALGLFKNTVSAGIVSGLGRAIHAAPDPKKPIQELRGLLQTDAAINPGNSGGPLINLKGETIGINAAVVFGAQNVGFAIPINYAKRDLEDLRIHGKIRRPLLGLRYLTVGDDLKDKMKLPVSYGALVVGPHHRMPAVIPDSPAAAAGLLERDIVLSCDGEKITAAHTIQDILETREVGDVLRLTVLRAGKEFNCNVTLAERK